MILVRYSEIAVKRGATRTAMERLLARNLAAALSPCGGVSVSRSPGRIVVVCSDEDCCAEAAKKVFGVKSISRAMDVGFSSLADIVDAAEKAWSGLVRGRRFKVEAVRVGSHDFSSYDVKREVGARLSNYGTVDVKSPEVVLHVEIRGERAYLYTEVEEGPGGLPLGSEGKVLALVSGGIDSPVAAWYMMRRGTHVDVLYCNPDGPVTLYPVLRVIERLLSQWSHGYNARVHVAQCHALVDAIRSSVEPALWTVAFRRALYLLGARIAARAGARGMATGESLGQVSSQTLDNLWGCNLGVDIPIFRPLIGMDKDEIVAMARRIGTYELSVQVPEYCAVFSRRPRKWVSREEISRIDRAIGDALDAVQVKVVRKSELPRYMDEVKGEILSMPDIFVDGPGQGHILVRLRRGDEADSISGGGKYVLHCDDPGLALATALKLRERGIDAYVLKDKRGRPEGSVGTRPFGDR